uniref:Uncharacterized protein n=1 Tax=Alexandrium monilatum TaxID=311494 RepID=A0A7S4PT50_9DINO
MGANVVRVVEPGYDELPARLKLRAAPIKAQDADDMIVGQMLRNGHQQSDLEANLEAWVLRQCKSLGEVVAGRHWTVQVCSAACNGNSPLECADVVAISRSDVLPETEEELISMQLRSQGTAAGSGTARDLPGMSVASEPPKQQPKPLRRIKAPLTMALPASSTPPATTPPQPSLSSEDTSLVSSKKGGDRPAALLTHVAPAAPAAPAPSLFDDSPPDAPARSRLCDTFCCRQEPSISMEKVVIIDQYSDR